jgi:hypothetical protein
MLEQLLHRGGLLACDVWQLLQARWQAHARINEDLCVFGQAKVEPPRAMRVSTYVTYVLGSKVHRDEWMALHTYSL